jgi:hypothetical protein
MSKNAVVALCCLLLGACANPGGPDDLRPIWFTVHEGYIGGGIYNGTNQTLFYVFKDKPSFEALFSICPPPNSHPPIPDSYFQTRLILAVVKIGNSGWEMDIGRIRYCDFDKTLHVYYAARLIAKDMSWIARIPLVFSIPRLDVDTVKFYENGEYTAELVVGE